MKFTSMFFPASAVYIRFIKYNYKILKKWHLRKFSLPAFMSVLLNYCFSVCYKNEIFANKNLYISAVARNYSAGGLHLNGF